MDWVVVNGSSRPEDNQRPLSNQRLKTMIDVRFYQTQCYHKNSSCQHRIIAKKLSEKNLLIPRRYFLILAFVKFQENRSSMTEPSGIHKHLTTKISSAYWSSPNFLRKPLKASSEASGLSLELLNLGRS